MSDAVRRSDSDAESLHRLVFATRVGGLAHLVAALRGVLDAEVGLFDLGGSTIATAPARAIWDPEAVRHAAGGAASELPLLVRAVELDGETVALLAVRTAGGSELVLDTAVDLVVIELGRLRAAQQGRRELAEALIDDVLSGRLSEADAIGRLRAVGLDATRPFRVLLGAVDQGTDGSPPLPLGGIYALMSDRPDPFLRIPLGEHVLMVVSDDAMVERIAQSLLGQLEEAGSAAGVGVSLAHTGGAGLRAGYFEALSALRDGAGVRHPGRLDLGRLLVTANTSVPLQQVARQQLGPLLDHDALHGSALVETLHAYLVADRDIVATTDRLFIHRNTLRYRLRQIAALLEVDLDSTAATASLWLAYTALADGDATVVPTERQDGAERPSGRNG